MLDRIWMVIAIPFGFALNGCYVLFKDVLHLPFAYLLALLLFALIANALLFPLALKQQRTTAIASAYKPMIDEINRKYADDKKKQGEELTKLEREFGYKPAGGCLPIFLQFPIIFGLIEVINKPLSYMLRLSEGFITELTSATAALVTDVTGLSVTEATEKIAITLSGRNIEGQVIEQVKENAGVFSGIVENNPVWAGELRRIADLDMSIGSVNLYGTPHFEWSWMILIPIFSVVTTVLSSYISMRNSTGFQNRNSMRSGILLMAISGVMFAWFSYIFPLGFSLYWGISNLFVIAQSFIVRRICNADAIIEEEQIKIAAKREAEKAAKKVRIRERDGTFEIKEFSEDELTEFRVLRARELDAERYGEEMMRENKEGS